MIKSEDIIVMPVFNVNSSILDLNIDWEGSKKFLKINI